MDKLKYIKLENEDGSYSSSIPLAVDSDYVNVNGSTLTNVLTTKANVSDVNTSIANLQTEISSVASGGPAGVYDTVIALTAADPDHSRIYLVTADNHWYYYNSGWQDGGLYQIIVEDDRVKDLEGNQIIGEANGSEIVVTDAYNTRPRYLGIDAIETTQETTTGANLLVVDKTTETTINGITITPIGNGKYKLNGTATALTEIWLQSYNYSTTQEKLNANTTYYFKTFFEGSHTRGLICILYSAGTTVFATTETQTYNGFAFTPSEDIYQNGFKIGMPNGASYTNCIIGCEISTSNPTSYEPYTGGIASPNPDYPQDVETMVGIRNRINVAKNYTFAGVQTITSLMDLEPNTQYTITCSNVIKGGANAPQLRINNVYYAITNNMKTTFTTGDNISATYIYSNGASASSSEGVTSTINELMIIEGTEEKPYVPYGTNYMVLDDIGNNLFDGEIESGAIDVYTGDLVVNPNKTRSANFIKVKPDTTYYIRRQTTSGIKWIVGYKSDKTIVTDGGDYPATIGALSVNVTKGSFTTTSTTEYIKWYDTVSTNLNENVMISKSDLPYEPYQHKQYPIPLANQELLNKSDYVDKIIVDESTEQSYIEQLWGKVVLDGSENNISLTTSTNYNTFTISILGMLSGNNLLGFCNYFKNYNWHNQVIGAIAFGWSDKSVYMYMPTDYDTVEKFKNWLSTQYDNGNPVELHYPLATPQLIPIDNPNIKLLNGVNHITNSEGAEMDIVYVKDINAVINSLNTRIIELEQAE